MNVKAIVSMAAIMAAGMVPTGAFAQTTAIAVADLNIRSGPGPDYPVIGAIRNNDRATIIVCPQDSNWCQVTYDGREGWAYSRYLTIEQAPGYVRERVIVERRTVIAEPTVRYGTRRYETRRTAEPTTVGGAINRVVVGPIAATVGGIAGAVAGPTIDPPEEVYTYVADNPVEPVYVEDEVVVGARIPETVVLQPVPDYDYEYVYVNDRPVLVEPASRRIVYIYR